MGGGCSGCITAGGGCRRLALSIPIKSSPQRSTITSFKWFSKLRASSPLFRPDAHWHSSLRFRPTTQAVNHVTADSQLFAYLWPRIPVCDEFLHPLGEFRLGSSPSVCLHLTSNTPIGSRDGGERPRQSASSVSTTLITCSASLSHEQLHISYEQTYSDERIRPVRG